MTQYLISERDVLRFNKYLVRNQETHCLEWTGCLNREGYGHIRIHKSDGSWATIRTHRLAWIITNGPIPDDLYVLHKCDNPKCCEVSHLFLGTPQDNATDCRAKGRQNIGEKQGNSKLTEKEVIAIRAEHKAGRYNQYQLASLFGVARRTINDIVNNKRWKHLIAT